MTDLLQLWLPILVAAIAVFVASSLIHMVFKWHNGDYRKLPNEDEVRAAIRAGSPAPGQYGLPHCTDMKQMQEPDFLRKYNEGPNGLITLLPNRPPAMGKALLLWFVFNIAVAKAAAFVTLQAVGLHADPHRAGHLVGLITFLTYAGGSVSLGIWMGKPWGSVAKDLLDALIYGTVSALAFWWLWP